MRFLVLVVTAVGVGAASVIGAQRIAPQHGAKLVAALQSARTQVAQFRLSDLNPISAAFEKVQREVGSPDPAVYNFPVRPPPIVVGTPLQLPQFGAGQTGSGASAPTTFPHNQYWPPQRR